MINKRNIFIALLLLAIIVLGIIGLFFANKQPKTPAQTLYTDPGSGESIVQNSPLKQSALNNPDPERPTFLGFTKLLDKGLSSKQFESVQNAVYSYSSQKSLGFKEVSLTTSSLETTPVGNNTTDYYMNFMISVNRKTQYYIHITYTDFTSCTTNIYSADKATLLFTQ